MDQPFKIIICGEGGQGALSVAEIIAYAAWMQGKQATAMPFFSTEKRGGVSMAFVQVSDAPIPFPKFDKADLWVALSQRSVDRIFSWLKEGTKVIVNTHLVTDLASIAEWRPFEVDAHRIAREQFKKPRVFNMIVMGAMAGLIPGLDRATFAKALDSHFKPKYEKDPLLRDLNLAAFDAGYALTHK